MSGTGAARQITANNPTLETAVPKTLPTGVQLVLSGHVHGAEVLSYGASAHRPPQLVAGNGGSALDHGITTTLPGTKLAGATLRGGEVASRFGYLTLQPSTGRWSVGEHDETGAVWATCAVQQDTATCH